MGLEGNKIQNIISLAILKVNWDLLSKDYIENFVPIAAECIRLSPHEIVTLDNMQSDLEKYFSLNIPQHVIKQILKRVNKRGYIKSENNAYIRNNSRLKNLNYKDVRDKVLAMHESVICKLVKFAQEKYNLPWGAEEAEQALQTFIDDNQLSIIAYSGGFSPIFPKRSSHQKGEKFVVGVFINFLLKSKSLEYDYFETLVKGNMLANAIFLTEPGEVKQRFRNTSVYFDTPVLINALGYAGKTLQQPCIEQIEMLYTAGASLKCFRHTLDEIDGILGAIERTIRQGQLQDAYGLTDYFISEGLRSSDIELLAINLVDSLKAIRVEVVDKPPYIEKFLIDEFSLSAALEKAISYKSEKALQRDVDSISAIIRLREGMQSNKIEECRALFVTNNIELVRVARNFYSEKVSPRLVPPSIPNFVLTNLLWLKLPNAAPELPKKRLIADYYAATQPEEHLWKYYLTEIDKLEQSGQYSEDDYYLLRHSLDAKAALMESTLGEETAFSEGTIPEILDRIYSSIREEAEKEIISERKQREYAEKEADLLLTAELERNNRIKVRANKYAKMIVKGFELLIILFLGFIFYSTRPNQMLQFNIGWLQYMPFISSIILIAITIWSFMYGTNINNWLSEREISIAKRLGSIFFKISGE